jgi:hypothetical protein
MKFIMIIVVSMLVASSFNVVEAGSKNPWMTKEVKQTLKTKKGACAKKNYVRKVKKQYNKKNK